MRRATLNKSLEVKLPSYLGLGKAQTPVIFSPNDGKGLRIISPKTGGYTAVNDNSLRAHNGLARYLECDIEGTVVKVLEHTLSALGASSITDVDIAFPEGITWNFFPVVGPGITPLYGKLLEHKIKLENSIETYAVKSSESFQYGGGRIDVSPSDKLSMIVQTYHRDLVDLDPQPLVIEDVYKEIESHVSARPVARLQTCVNAFVFRALSTLNKGITDDTYILARRGESVDDIVSKMHSQYQDGRNEHCAHTAIADFLGELKSFFPGRVLGHFKISGTANHTTRMQMLRQMKEAGIFSVS